MRVLVLTAFYPTPDGKCDRMFVHVRNLYYQKNGIDVTVLNFDSKVNYDIDGIRVITKAEFSRNSNAIPGYDIVISHSANLRNHFIFIRKYEKKFNRLVFFFHGHEFQYLYLDYPKPYSCVDNPRWYKIFIQNVYDYLKIKIWANYYRKLAYKSEYVFVSRYALELFKNNTGVLEKDLNNNVHIINNSVAAIFESFHYDEKISKPVDFITIRSNIDRSTYCIDLLIEYAKRNPNKVFMLIGKGRLFDYFEKPSNLMWIDRVIGHKEIVSYLNLSKCGLMLTRHDTQGVMACEMETFGIPLVTSDTEACHEFFDNKKNVVLISNDYINERLSEMADVLFQGTPYQKDASFFSANTIHREIDLFNQMICRRS